MNKLLVAIFSVLLIIALGELSYILFFGAKTNPTPKASNIIDTSPSPTPFLNPAIDKNSVSMLSYWHKGVVNSVKTTVELDGTITSIDRNGTAKEHDWPVYNYALKIRIQGDNNSANDIFLGNDDIKKTTLKNKTDQIIDFDQLKVGDKIQVSLNFDLTKDFANNFVSGQIIKLQ